MTIRRARRTFARVAGIGVSAAVLVAMSTTPAFADTSTASANAATLKLGTATLLTTGTCAASSPGGQSGSCGNVPLALLGAQTTLGAGLLAQQAGATGGLSAACAGAVGNGGTIQIGPGNTCAFTPGSPSGGVTLNLGVLAALHADAIIAECSASSTGAPTAQVQLVNATLHVLSIPPQDIPITSPVAKNTSVANLGALLNITLNSQPATQPAGTITTTALRANVLGLGGTPLVSITVGTVSCGPNSVTAPTSAFPVAGTPIAAGMFLIAGYLGWRFWWTPRRRAESTPV
ncbi:MAG: hypothetical protein QOK39_1308 [Acidimicrobiaceae bacterium]|jgi:hypothetical protein|nr:hypothetical protein [Acidimicrobiaceae bacterium]